MKTSEHFLICNDAAPHGPLETATPSRQGWCGNMSGDARQGVRRLRDDEILELQVTPANGAEDDSFITIGEAARRLIARYLAAARREMIAEMGHGLLSDPVPSGAEESGEQQRDNNGTDDELAPLEGRDGS